MVIAVCRHSVKEMQPVTLQNEQVLETTLSNDRILICTLPNQRAIQ